MVKSPVVTYPMTTRQVVKLLRPRGATEDRLNDLMRRGKLAEPPWERTRRLWYEADVKRAEIALAEHGGSRTLKGEAK